MQITVIGSGYVGLVVGTCLSNVGHHVVCADIDEEKVRRLLEGEIPFYEPGLSDLVKRNLKAGRLNFTTDVKAACRRGAVIFIAVGTPQGDDGSAELRYVYSVADTIGECCTKARMLWWTDIKWSSPNRLFQLERQTKSLRSLDGKHTTLCDLLKS